MNNRKGQLELSANFIVVIIISIVILVGGLALFYNILGWGNTIKANVDKQTQDNIKSMMLSNNYRVAVFPQDGTIYNGKSLQIGIGVTNIYDVKKVFDLSFKVKRYTKAVPDGESVVPPEDISSYVDLYADASENQMSIGPSQQAVKGLLLKMPKNAVKGQYKYIINVTTTDISNSDVTAYGVMEIYINNP